MWDRLKECPVLDQLLPAPMWWKMSTGVKTYIKITIVLNIWFSDCQNITFDNWRNVQWTLSSCCWCWCGKASQEEQAAACIISLHCPTPSLHCTASLHCAALSVRVCARGFRRCCSSSPTPASPPRVLRTPATMFPPAIKPFPTTVGSSVTKTAPANIVRTPSTMAVLILLGELSPTCSVIKIPHMEVPGKCQLQLLRCGRMKMYEKWHDMKSGNNGSRRQLRETRQTKLSDQKNNKNSQKIIAKKPTWRWKKWSCFHTVCSTDWIPWGFWSFKSPGFKNIEFYAVTVAVKWRRPLKYVASKFQLANGSLRWEGGGRAASL